MSIVLNFSESWKNIAEDKSVQLLGYIHDIENHQSALMTVKNIGNWTTALKHLKGFYSLVKYVDSKVFAAVDHIRSRPLFYAEYEKKFYLSDSAEWVRKQVNDTEMDEYAKAEFQLTGYVTGNDTLYKNVKQLQAGECLVYSDNTLSVERYYSFEHIEPEDYNENTLLAELDTVSKASIQRLIQYANGRQVVIPLSGGYDSRLIAALLKEANYENILTFTYGVRGNKEAAYSKIVADNLGLKWCFIEYTEALWQVAWQTEERKRYQLEGANWTSLAHMQDWLAVKVIKEQGMADNNAVFVPGHSGDMVAGSHIPNFIHKNLTAKYTKDELVEHLFNKHYCLTEHRNIGVSLSSLKKNIENSLILQDEYTAQDFANECEKHNWQNRQSKYIFNSVRVYEFFDYDWWVPLWDKDFVGFFEGLPLPLRNHEWYIEYVQKKYNEHSKKIEDNLGNASQSGLAGTLSSSKLLKKIKLRGFLKFIYRFYVKFSLKKPDSLLINSAQKYSGVKKLEKSGYLMNGITIYYFLKEFTVEAIGLNK